MKSALKKVLSLMLVAMLLVSAIPFQASAAGDLLDGSAVLDDTALPNDGDLPGDSNSDDSLLPDDANTILTPDDIMPLTDLGGDDNDVTITPNPSDPTATDGTTSSNSITFLVKVDGAAAMAEATVTPSNGKDATVENMIKYYFDKDWASNYIFSHYWIKGETNQTHDGEAVLKDQISVGNTVHVALTTKGSGSGTGTGTSGTKYSVKFVHASGNLIKEYVVSKGNCMAGAFVANCSNSAVPSGYSFAGWKTSKDSGTLYSNKDVAGMAINGPMTFYAVATKNGTGNKFPYEVYLHIYLNNKVDEPAKNVNITDGIAVDGVVNQKEVESVVKQYYSAKNSDGIQYDGLYMARGNWVSNFVNNQKRYSEITGINDMRQESEVHINVMVTNANVKTSSNNNSTNPKTGDSVVMTVSALGITASALAAAYYVSKKRMSK